MEKDLFRIDQLHDTPSICDVHPTLSVLSKTSSTI